MREEVNNKQMNKWIHSMSDGKYYGKNEGKIRWIGNTEDGDGWFYFIG